MLVDDIYLNNMCKFTHVNVIALEKKMILINIFFLISLLEEWNLL